MLTVHELVIALLVLVSFDTVLLVALIFLVSNLSHRLNALHSLFSAWIAQVLNEVPANNARDSRLGRHSDAIKEIRKGKKWNGSDSS
jgi:hypothetical protein